MYTSQEYIQIINANMPRIQDEFGVRSMSIFGSVARGDNGVQSDVDILVDMPPKIFLMNALKEYLEQILHTSVDLVRRHSHLSSKFLTQVHKDAITIL